MLPAAIVHRWWQWSRVEHNSSGWRILVLQPALRGATTVRCNPLLDNTFITFLKTILCQHATSQPYDSTIAEWVFTQLVTFQREPTWRA